MTDQRTERRADVSIIIPAKNEAHNIGSCLAAIYRQKTGFSYQITVIDSGSEDNTLAEVAAFREVRVISIPSESFGHGRTRNLGARLAEGRFLVFLNADALPADEYWLENLVRPLAVDNPESPSGVFSRHLPRKDCHLYMVRDLTLSMPEQPLTITRAGKLDFMLFSTVSAAMRKETWEQCPFRDDILIAEDQEWGARLISSGRFILYNPESRVIHSHNYTPGELMKIKENTGRTLKPFGKRWQNRLAGLALAAGGALFKFAGDVRYILFQAPGPVSPGKKLREIRISAAARICSFLGRYKGWLYG